MWFLPGDGVSVIDPRHIPDQQTPAAGTHRANHRRPQDVWQRPVYRALRLPPRIRDLEIDYTALSFVAPEKVRFRFKLEGRDRDWKDVGTRPEGVL